MTKLISVRVTVAADNPVTVETVKSRLAAIVSAAGTEVLPDAHDGMRDGARIHWSTVEVVQGADRLAVMPAKRKRGAVAGQAELPP